MTARGERGFLPIETIIFVLVIGLVVLAAFVMFFKQSKNNATMPDDTNTEQTAKNYTTAKPQLKQWPVVIDEFNLSTQQAGDVYLRDEVLISEVSGESELPVTEFGRERGKKGISMAVEFLTRREAPVYSASDGYVLAVTPVKNNGLEEFSVQVAPEKAQTTQWTTVYQHLAKVEVKAGDTLQSGQRIGAAAPYGADAPFSRVGLQVVRYAVSNVQGTPEAQCPSRFMKSDARQQMTADFLLLTKAWEEQSSNGGAYNEPAWARLGCVADTLKL